MPQKKINLMLFSRNTIRYFVPNVNAVYYLRGIADENSLYPIYYIGRAENNDLKSKLLKIFEENEWNDIIYLNYIECEDPKQIKVYEEFEIKRHQPKYNLENEQVKTFVHTPTYNLNFKLN
jgi:excinuclease UvrABC nuclease subunit